MMLLDPLSRLLSSNPKWKYSKPLPLSLMALLPAQHMNLNQLVLPS